MSTWPDLSIAETPIYESMVAANGDPHAADLAVQPYAAASVYGGYGYGGGYAAGYGAGMPPNMQAIAETVVRAVGTLMGQNPYAPYGPGVAVGGDGGNWFVAVVGGPQTPCHGYPAYQQYAGYLPPGYQAYAYPQQALPGYAGGYQALQPAAPAAAELPAGSDSGIWDTSGVWDTDGLDAAGVAAADPSQLYAQTQAYDANQAYAQQMYDQSQSYVQPQVYDQNQYAQQAYQGEPTAMFTPVAEPSASMVPSAPPSTPQPDTGRRRQFSIGRLSVSI